MAKKRSFWRRAADFVLGRGGRTARCAAPAPFRRVAIETLGSPSCYVRHVALEPLEKRNLLSALVYAPNGTKTGWTADINNTDWWNGLNYTNWANTNNADFQSSTAGPVAIADISIGQNPIYTSKITVQGGNYTFVASAPSDVLAVPTGGTTIEADQASGTTTVATFSLPMVDPSGGTAGG